MLNLYNNVKNNNNKNDKLMELSISSEVEIDFSKVDSRIKHSGIWLYSWPMQTGIQIPESAHKEIYEKLIKTKGIVRVSPEPDVKNEKYIELSISSKVEIDFSKVDSRIEHSGIWLTSYPMQTGIKIPASAHKEIYDKLINIDGVVAVSPKPDVKNEKKLKP